MVSVAGSLFLSSLSFVLFLNLETKIHVLSGILSDRVTLGYLYVSGVASRIHDHDQRVQVVEQVPIILA